MRLIFRPLTQLRTTASCLYAAEAAGCESIAFCCISTGVFGYPQDEAAKVAVDTVRGKDYFVITTNVDHQFQLAGFDKSQLFYTQGDYGLFQCSGPCTNETYDNEEAVREMYEQQKGLRIPSELIPTCPHCGRPMMMNLRIDNRFMEDAGWHAAQARYEAFCRKHDADKLLYLELGVGMNTPVIVKYPFWNAVVANENATYACVNLGEACAPEAIVDRSILIDGDFAQVLSVIRDVRTTGEQELM